MVNNLSSNREPILFKGIGSLLDSADGRTSIYVTMKQLLIFTSLALILFSYCSKKAFNMQSIKGRWYFVENGIYKEIHANDSILFLFNYQDPEYKAFFNDYFIRNDTLYSIYPFADQLPNKMPPYLWGKIQDYTVDSIVLIKGTNKLVFTKIDMMDSIFVYQLYKYYDQREFDSTKYKKWIQYQTEYYDRAKEYLKIHPELMYKGEL